MMLAKFFGYVLSLSKITYQQKSVRISQTFLLFMFISLTYKCEKFGLFECFANTISLRLNKILFASFKNFILLVASHILCVN